MRVLATSTANSGHFSPLVPVLKAFVNNGDEVLVVTPPGLAEAAHEAGLRHVTGGAPPADEVAAIWERVPRVPRSEASVLVNREIFGRLDTEALLPAVADACASWHPDLLLHEPAEFAAAVVADRLGLPHAYVAIGLAGVEVASMRIAEPALQQYRPDFVQWALTAPYLTRFPEPLDPSAYPDTRRFRESTPAAPDPLPEWWDGSADPLVYVSFGTVAGRLPVAPAVYRAAIEAVADLPVRVLLTTGRTREVGELGPLPRHAHAEPWVDQQAAFAAASLVVCHGGAGTMFGALAVGLPQVVVPLMADQFTNGRVVADAGAGVVVRLEQGPRDEVPDSAALAGRIRAAIEDVLARPSYREAADSIAVAMRGMPSLDDVVTSLTRS